MTRPNLRKDIARDLKPTRPLRRPSTRALALVPIAVAIVVGVPLLHAFRGDMGTIGFLRAWGFSIAQTAAGLTIVTVAFRESIPGRSVSVPVLAATFLAGIVLPGAVLLLTTSHFDVGPSHGGAIPEGLACFRLSALAALPALVLAGVLAARAFPLRPGAAGGLYGLGSGLTADAGLRLYCDYSTPGHVIFSHIGAVAATAVVGAAVAVVVERVRRR
jgi:hypothetical protein